MIRLSGQTASYAVVASVLLSAAAAAQTPASDMPASAAAVPAADADAGLSEIVVTAQKRSENLQKVPIAISALSSEQLEQQGIRNVNAIISQVPNMHITTPYSDAVPIFSLRGISAVDYSQNQSGPIALYVDEVYKGAPVFTSLQIFDLDRIEVLRGPQGTLYGKNTTGGAVNIYTKQPDLQAGFTGNLTAGYGRFDRRALNGGVNIPVVDEVVAARLGFSVTKVDGFVRNRLPDRPDLGQIDDWAFRASLAVRPSDTVDIVARYTQSKSSPTGYGPLADDIGPGGVGFDTGYTREGLGFFENEQDIAGRLRIKNRSGAVRVTWDLSDRVGLTSVSSYDEGRWFTQEDGDASPFRIAEFEYLSDARAYSQDLRIASSGNDPFKWLVGAYFNKDRILSRNVVKYFYNSAGDSDGNGVNDCLDTFFIGCRASNDFKQKRESFALYTQNSYRFENGLTVTAGLRYTEDDNRLSYYRASLGYFDPATQSEVLNALPTITAPPVDRLKSDNLSGKIGLSYEFPNGALLYANASRGYRGGSFNGAAFFDPAEVTAAVPERLDALEVGLKAQAFDNRLRVNAAGFYYDYRDQQFIDITPEFLQVLRNAPKSRLWGGELDLLARPVEALTLRFGVSYLNAKFKEITLAGVDLAGNRLLVAPTWTLTGGVDWKIVTGDFGAVTLHTDSRYSSKLYFEAFNTPGLEQDPYWIHDARLTYDTANERVSVAAWMKNILNEKYRVYRSNLSAFNFNYAQRGRPREYGIELTYRF